MPSTVEYLPAQSLICVTNRGEHSLEDYVAATREVSRLMTQHGVRNCLIDGTELRNQATSIDIYNLPKLYNQIGIPKTIRAALLVGDQSHPIEDIRFFETVCLNSGYSVRIFSDRNAALNWLAC
jgi:hypothetical protein